MLVFVVGGKPDKPESNPQSKDENQQLTQPTDDVNSMTQTRATLLRVNSVISPLPCLSSNGFLSCEELLYLLHKKSL